MTPLQEGDAARRIIASVAARYGVPVIDILGHVRSAKTDLARQIAIREVRAAMPDWSLPRLGRLFCRDHTTIVHALREGNVRDRRLQQIRVINAKNYEAALSAS